MKGIDLSGFILEKVNLTGANLEGANLTGANLTGANLTGANLEGANLTGANLEVANLTEANLIGTNITGANLTGANLTGANLKKTNLKGIDLSGFILEKVNLTGANLEGANLEGANLEGANLTGANLKTAILKYGNLQETILYAANLTNTDLRYAKLTKANLEKADISKAKVFGIAPWLCNTKGMIKEDLDFSEKGSGDFQLPVIFESPKKRDAWLPKNEKELRIKFKINRGMVYAEDMEKMIQGLRIIYNLSILDYNCLRKREFILHEEISLELIVPHRKKLQIIYLNFCNPILLLKGVKEGLKTLAEVLKENFKFIVSRRYKEAVIKKEEAESEVADKTTKPKILKEWTEAKDKIVELAKKINDQNWEQDKRRIKFLDEQINKIKDNEMRNYLIIQKNKAIKNICNNYSLSPKEIIDSEGIYSRKEI